jgi:hypothetical protein
MAPELVLKTRPCVKAREIETFILRLGGSNRSFYSFHARLVYFEVATTFIMEMCQRGPLEQFAKLWSFIRPVGSNPTISAVLARRPNGLGFQTLTLEIKVQVLVGQLWVFRIRVL